MSKMMVVTMVDGTKHLYPANTYSQYENGVLMLKDRYSEPEWWVCITLRNVVSWGEEEVEQ